MDKKEYIIDINRLKEILYLKITKDNKVFIMDTIQKIDNIIDVLENDLYHGLALETRLGIVRKSFADLVIKKHITLTSEERLIWESFKEKEGNKAVKNSMFGYLLSFF